MNTTVLPPESLWIMDVPVVPFESYEQALACIGAAIAARRKTFCVAINPEKLYRASRDSELRDVLRRAEIGICDGVGVALGARLLYGRRVMRCTGVDLFYALLRAAAAESWKIFLLGASQESSELAHRKLRDSHPRLQIVGCQHGYFPQPTPVIERINTSGADVLFVAMGSPRQELWISQHRDAIDAPFCMGIGGTLDVVSGTAKRAPRLCRKTGTEFLYRVITQPRRIRRQLVLPLFAWTVLTSALMRRQRRLAVR